MPMRLTVRQNLTILVASMRWRICVSASRTAADLDLGDFLDRAKGKLSAGQKTRVALAKAADQPARTSVAGRTTARSIPIPPTGSGDILRPIARLMARPSCWRRITMLKWSDYATASSS